MKNFGFITILVMLSFSCSKNSFETVVCSETPEDTLIISASPNNKRNDQSCTMRLADGQIVTLYTRFGSQSGDPDESSIYRINSNDDGKTWEGNSEFIEKLSLGSYIPSMYQKKNGNILIIFFVREATFPSYRSSIRQIEYSSDLSQIVSPMRILLEGAYYPIASNRIFYDEQADKLLFPYPKLITGGGSSAFSLYKGGLLESDDDGNSWNDLGIITQGVVNTDNFGGCTEPGIFRKGNTLVYYFRTLLGSIYACDLEYVSNTYNVSEPYNLGIDAVNAESSITWIPELNIYVAAYIRSYDDPVYALRKYIDISTSVDGVVWERTYTVSDVDRDGLYSLNYPSLYVDKDKEQLLVTFSPSPSNGEYSLQTTSIPFCFFTN